MPRGPNHLCAISTSYICYDLSSLFSTSKLFVRLSVNLNLFPRRHEMRNYSYPSAPPRVKQDCSKDAKWLCYLSRAYEIFFFKWAILCLFIFIVTIKNHCNNICQWLDSNPWITCGKSYKASTIVNYNPRVVIWGIFKSGSTLEL